MWLSQWQCVSYNGIVSTLRDITCGVPLLFIIYTNYVPTAFLHSWSTLFTDDTAIVYSFLNVDNEISYSRCNWHYDTNWISCQSISLTAVSLVLGSKCMWVFLACMLIYLSSTTMRNTAMLDFNFKSIGIL